MPGMDMTGSAATAAGGLTSYAGAAPANADELAAAHRAYPAALPAALAQQVGRARAALIASVEDGGPAAAAGLQVGDLVFELDGVAIDGPEALRAALGDRPGKTCTVGLVRGGARQDVEVALGSQA